MKKISYIGEFWILYLIIFLLTTTMILQFKRIETLEGNNDVIREKYIELQSEVQND